MNHVVELIDPPQGSGRRPELRCPCGWSEVMSQDVFDAGNLNEDMPIRGAVWAQTRTNRHLAEVGA